MAFQIRLFLDSVEVGFVEFTSLLVKRAFRCEPPDILSEKEVRELTMQLIHVPLARSGTVGKYNWTV